MIMNLLEKKDKSTGELNNDLVVMKAPYHTERWVIATNKEKIPEINTLAVFMYNKIGVELDTLPDAHLTSSFMGKLRNNVVHYPSILTAIEDLKSGKIQAVAGLKSQLEQQLKFNQNKDKYFMTKKIDYVKSKWDIGIAVRTDFRPLGYEIEGYIEEYIRSGTLEKIFNKYDVNYEIPLALQ